MPPPDSFNVDAQQVAAKLQADSVVAETLASADVTIKVEKASSNYTPEHPRFENNEVAEDLGPAPDFVGGRRGRISMRCPLKTSGVVGTAPGIARYLEALGMQQEAVRQISIGAPSGGDGAFKAGDAYSATGGKTGVIEQDRTGAGTLRFIVVSGGDIANGDTITSSGDSAVASSSATAYGIKFRPRSTGQKTLTIQLAEKNDQGTAGQDLLTRLRSAMGTGRITCQGLDAMRLEAEYQGIEDLAGAGSFFTGVVYEATSAPQFANAVCQVDGVSFRVSQVAFDFGVTINMDPEPTTAGGLAGYDQARISEQRRPVITLDPWRRKASEFDDLGKLKDGTQMPFSWIIGTTPNLIEVAVLKAQIRAVTPGAREGKRAPSIQLFPVRNTLIDNEYAIYFR